MRMTCTTCGHRAEEGAAMIAHDIQEHGGMMRLEEVHRVCCVPAGRCICRVSQYRGGGCRTEGNGEDRG